MPIIGKTDSATVKERIDLDVIGRVWVGDTKTDNSAGKTLNNRFRIECNDRTREVFKEHYGTDRPDKINILLPFATPDENYHTWYESYTAQGFQHRCNGQRIVQKMCQTPWSGLKGEQRFSWERKDVNEPCLKGDAPECAACGKGNGRFFFYIRELYASGMGATKAWMMSISGTHNLTGLHDQLSALYKQYGALDVSPVPSPWTFGFIPYTLTRVEKKIMRPNQKKDTINGVTGWHQDGTRSKGSYWAISISEDAEWLATLQRFMAFQEAQKLGGGAEAIALIGGNIPILPAYQESSIWGDTERQIRQATNPRQIAAAIDVVRDEVSQGNLPADAITKAETLANSYQPVQKPISKPKKVANDTAEKVLEKFTGLLQKATLLEQISLAEDWVRKPDKWAAIASLPHIDDQIKQLVKDRILQLGSVAIKPPALDDEEGAEEDDAIEPEVMPEYDEFDTED